MQSDYRYRGYSLSDERPVGSLTLVYDHPSGFYVGGSVLGTLRNGRPDLVGAQGNAGYAARLSPSVSLDGGLIHLRYERGYGGYSSAENTEAYLGVYTRHFSSRVYFSPDYFRSGSASIYAEIEAGVEIATDWSLNAHLGGQRYLGDTPKYQRSGQIDWRLGTSRRFGPYGLFVELSGGGAGYEPSPHYPHETIRRNSETAFVIGATRSF